MISVMVSKWCLLYYRPYYIKMVFYLYYVLIEGLRAKRAYIEFLADFHFMQKDSVLREAAS